MKLAFPHAAFRHLSTIEGIDIDLRYAGPHNFIGRDLYSPYDCAWLHADAAEALERVVGWLAVARPGARALVPLPGRSMPMDAAELLSLAV